MQKYWPYEEWPEIMSLKLGARTMAIAEKQTFSRLKYVIYGDLVQCWSWVDPVGEEQLPLLIVVECS
jgi:hypothetical protein